MSSTADQPRLISATMRGALYVGEFVPAARAVDVTEKATGAVLFSAAIATAAEVSRVARVALDAQAAWAAMPSVARGDVLRRFAALCESHAAEIGEWIVRETGSIPPKATFEIMTSAREATEVAGYTAQPAGFILASPADRPSYARRVPLGVVAAITPWNSPFVLAARAALPALAMGNAVVLKPDVQTPVSGGYLLAKLFELAGMPKGVFCVVPGDAETGEALTKDANVAMVSFTGSTVAGRKVATAAAQTLKKVALELGGNNAAIIFEDADIDRMVSAASFGSFFHQGQICFTTGRHLVHESVADRYAEALASHARNLHVGDPHTAQVHLGPMINERQAARAEKLLRDTVAAGATVIAGGNRSGLFFEPTVVSNVSRDMPLFREETFGPIAPITTFSTEAEAVELANDSEYGLVASIYGADQARSMRVASRLKTGIVHINDQTVVHEVYGPIGGMGASGNGARSGGPSAMDEFSQWQWVTVGTDVPQYPF
jgi:benzaldehyde dehydrogenase (NAD)